MAALIAGHVAAARRELLHAAETPEAGPIAQTVAALGAGVAGLFMGQRHAAIEIEGAASAADAMGLEWLARVGRSTLGLGGTAEALNEAEAVAVAARGAGDGWGEAIARICLGWGGLLAGREAANMEETAQQLRGLGAPVLESWAQSIAGIARVRSGEPDSVEAAVTAEVTARLAGVDAARMLAYMALAESAASELAADEYAELASGIARETGLLMPRPQVGEADRPMDAMPPIEESFGVRPPPVAISVLGSFALRLAGRDVDLTQVRPRARALLRLLCLNAGMPVHHEQLEAELWPDAGSDASSRNLHVAVAALRRVLEPTSMRGSYQLILREGDAYRFALPPGSDVDLLAFESALAGARTARERGERDRAIRGFQQALRLYRGDVLPEDGPAEWAAQRRAEAQLAAVEASQALAELLLESGDAPAAARACNVGLRVERYHDPLWRLLIRARDEAGDQGAAIRARISYDRVLAELGVSPAPPNRL